MNKGYKYAFNDYEIIIKVKHNFLQQFQTYLTLEHTLQLLLSDECKAPNIFDCVQLNGRGCFQVGKNKTSVINHCSFNHNIDTNHYLSHESKLLKSGLWNHKNFPDGIQKSQLPNT